MKLYSKKKYCSGCGACADRCPQKAISMVQDSEGFYYPKINKKICINCGKCEQVCPLKKKKLINCNNLYFGVQAIDDSLRYSSSSGGVFGLLAEYIIQKGGVVYGAAFNDHMQVVHQAVVELPKIDSVKKTKYVQSDMQGIYNSIEGNLKDGRWVLFCGTPCQSQALKNFLDRMYDRLIVVDLVCYGVPSPGIWEDYVDYLENKHNGKMTDFLFRDKRNADNGQTCSYVIKGREYVNPLHRDFFCRMYFKNCILRPACHNCEYCTVDRCTDFTIGDFWGIERCKPEMDDGMGTSMVIVHTNKAKMIWNKIKEKTSCFECMEEELLQPRLMMPTVMARSRRRFMIMYKILPLPVIVKWEKRKLRFFK